jgi:hypothetical protein
MRSSARCDAWEQTLSLLAQISSERPGSAVCTQSPVPAKRSMGTDARRAPSTLCCSNSAALVSVVERCSPTSVAICWCDATSGRYGDQVWKLRVARNKTICVLSGKAIRRGDPVYRPSMRGRAPANADLAISAEALEAWGTMSSNKNTLAAHL